MPDIAARDPASDDAVIRSAARRLRAQDLDSVSESRVHYLNDMYTAGEYVDSSRAMRWSWRVSESIDHWVCVSAGQHRMWLGLGAARADPAIDFDWRDCEGELRLVAWSASFHTLLERLAHIFRRDWTPTEFVSRDALPANNVRIGFALFDEQAVSATGQLVLPEPLLPLATNTPIRPGETLRALPAKLPLTVDRLWIDPGQLCELAIGSVICIRRGAFVDIGARLILHAGATKLVARVAASRLTVVAINPQPTQTNYRKEITVSEEANGPTDAAPSPVNPVPIDVDSMPVELCFHAGYLTTSYSELCAIQPGYVFELGQRLRDQRIDITANGALIGHGELVVIGEYVGVRLTALGSKTAAA